MKLLFQMAMMIMLTIYFTGVGAEAAVEKLEVEEHPEVEEHLEVEEQPEVEEHPEEEKQPEGEKQPEVEKLEVEEHPEVDKHLMVEEHLEVEEQPEVEERPEEEEQPEVEEHPEEEEKLEEPVERLKNMIQKTVKRLAISKDWDNCRGWNAWWNCAAKRFKKVMQRPMPRYKGVHVRS